VLDLTPYARAQVASGSSREVFSFELPETLPTGEYIFYAAVKNAKKLAVSAAAIPIIFHGMIKGS